MCLIVLAWRADPRYSLVVAANRDEFYRRPTEPADHWPDAPHIIAGRDREQGGSWLGITQTGRFAAVTNARGVGGAKEAPSRGLLVSDYLRGNESAHDYVTHKLEDIQQYAGCNLLVGDGKSLFYLTNHPEPEMRELTPGVHALSNGHIDQHWPKMQKVHEGLAAALKQPEVDQEALFDLMSDRSKPPADDLPNTGVGKILERQLSPVFIQLPVYGTRCTTTIAANHNGQVRFQERRFDAKGNVSGESSFDTTWPGQT